MEKLIPLNTLGGFADLSSGYFYNPTSDGVFSNKTGATVRLNGSYSGGVRRYNLQTKTNHRWSVVTRSIKHSDVVTSYKKVPLKTKNVVEKEMSLDEGWCTLDKTTTDFPKGWIVGTIKHNRLMMSTDPKIHLTEKSVNDEMVRLANIMPKSVFVKLKIESFVTATGVRWF